MQVILNPQTPEQWAEALAFAKQVHADELADRQATRLLDEAELRERQHDRELREDTFRLMSHAMQNVAEAARNVERATPVDPPRGEPVETPGPGSRANPQQRDAEPPPQERRFNTSL